MATIGNAKDKALNVGTGSIPNVNRAMANWFQPMVFMPVEKTVMGYQVVENGTPIEFRGVIQPLGARKLEIKPEGERAWTWHTLHADPSLKLQVDEVVTYLGVQTRVMARRDYEIYGYIEYELVQDWTGSGPEVES